MVSTILNLIRPRESSEGPNAAFFEKTSNPGGDFLSILNRELNGPGETRPLESRSYSDTLPGVADKNPGLEKTERPQERHTESRAKTAGNESLPPADAQKRIHADKTAEGETRTAGNGKTANGLTELFLKEKQGKKSSALARNENADDAPQNKKKSDLSGNTPAGLYAITEKLTAGSGIKDLAALDEGEAMTGKKSTGQGRAALLAEMMKRRMDNRLDAGEQKSREGESTARMASIAGKVKHSDRAHVSGRREEGSPQAARVQVQTAEITSAVTPSPQGNETQGAGAERHGENTNPALAPLKGPAAPSNNRGSVTFAESRPVLSQEQMERIMENARVTVRDGRNASLSLRLNPANLGRVTVNLGLEGGVLHGRFLVDSPEIRDAVEANIESIRRELEQSGVSVGEFQVNVRDDRQFQQARDYETPFPTAGNDSRLQAQSAREYTAPSLYDGAINYVI